MRINQQLRLISFLDYFAIPPFILLSRTYSKRCLQLFVLKKLYINHEVHEEHEEK